MAVKSAKKAPGYAGTGTETVHHADGSEVAKQEKVGKKIPPMTPLAQPNIKLGVTLNTGNFQSVRIDVGIMIPCELPEIDAVYDYMLGWVDERMTKLQKEVKAAYGLEQK